MIYTHSNLGTVICGDAFSREVSDTVDAAYGAADVANHAAQFQLTLCDPPYGEIVKEKWDVAEYHRWMSLCASSAAPNATIAMWGGIGKAHHRPFIEFAATVEGKFHGWEIKSWITWNKKRAYGVQDNYLFTREECLILTRGKPIFNVPLLETKRGYAGYNAKYPAKSEFFRRTNVWTDVTELLRGKVHPTQKPDRLYEILIETHSAPGSVVYDPCAGSLTTARAALKTGRRYCVIEKEREYIKDSGFCVGTVFSDSPMVTT